MLPVDLVINEKMIVELGLSCAGTCQDLESGMNGRGYISLANPFSMRQRRGLHMFLPDDLPPF